MTGDPIDPKHGLTGRLLGALHRQAREEPISSATEPCAGCGDETAVGSFLFAERHDFLLPDGRRAFLCAECHAKARAALGGRQLTEQDMRVIADNGMMVGVGFLGGGGGGF